MRRLIVTEFMTLDGVIEDPGGSEGTRHAGWSFRFQDPDGMQFKLEETLEASALLLGRVTYEGFAAAWPSITDEVGFAAKMNSMPKYVVSSTLNEPTWNNTTVLNSDWRSAVRRLKEDDGGPILVAGSASLVNALRSAGLVDEYRLMVYPIVLGSGKRLFADGEVTMLTLTANRSLSSGILILTYAPQHG